MIKVLLLFGCLLGLSMERPLSPKKIKWAVNAGSDISKRAHQGYTFEADKDFDQSVVTVPVDYSKDQTYNAELIKYTNDPIIYKTERHSYNSFHYNVPMEGLEEGKYVLILKFCEMYFDKPNKRVFNVRFGDHIVVKDLDIFGKSGKFTAHDEYIEFDYKRGDILVRGKSIGQSALKNGKLIVTFEKTGKDNPLVNGLVLVQGSLAETDHTEMQMFKEQWEKQHREELRKQYLEKQKRDASKLKKKEKIKIRNDHMDDLDEDFEEVEQQQKNPAIVHKEVPPLNVLLMTPMGVVSMIGFFVSSYVIIAFTFFDPYGQKKYQEETRQLLQKQALKTEESTLLTERKN